MYIQIAGYTFTYTYTSAHAFRIDIYQSYTIKNSGNIHVHIPYPNPHTYHFATLWILRWWRWVNHSNGKLHQGRPWRWLSSQRWMSWTPNWDFFGRGFHTWHGNPGAGSKGWGLVQGCVLMGVVVLSITYSLISRKKDSTLNHSHLDKYIQMRVSTKYFHFFQHCNFPDLILRQWSVLTTRVHKCKCRFSWGVGAGDAPKRVPPSNG